ncbi:MAG: BREX system ATP-binding domain-containing protein, partial [Thermodesulfobacteriota bacterium]
MKGPADGIPRIRPATAPVGRQTERALLMEALARLKGGVPGIVFISGDPGVGKTFLVQHISEMARQMGCTYGAGKFWPYSHNKPFAALFGSLREAAGGGDGASAPLSFQSDPGPKHGDFFPENPSGGPGPSGEDSPDMATGKLQLAVKSAVLRLARPEHPLVLFLDDLQWADRSTLFCLADLASDRDIPHLLVLGAFRSQELAEDHPLLEARARMLEKGARITQIILPRLSFPETLKLVSDISSVPESQVLPLAESVYTHTGGNPLFIHQYLLAGEEKETLSRNPRTGAWALASLTDPEREPSLAAYLEEKILKLPERSRAALLSCSCAGPNFPLSTAARLLSVSKAQVEKDLEPAVEKGLLRRDVRATGGGSAFYAFSHDRVLQVAHGLLDPSLARSGHLLLATDLDHRLSG